MYLFYTQKKGYPNDNKKKELNEELCWVFFRCCTYNSEKQKKKVDDDADAINVLERT